MSIFTVRSHGILLLILVVLLGWYLLGVKTPQDAHPQEEHAVDPVVERKPVVAPVPVQAGVAQEKKPVKKNETASIMDVESLGDIQVPVETEELVNWRMERGYPDIINTYDSYSEATLNALADSGDIRAMHTLAERYAKRDNATDADRAAAAQLHRQAALYGSTFAFLHLGVQQEAAYASMSADDPNRHAAAIEILATYKVAALRGDKMPNLVRGNHFVSQNKIELTEEDQQRIQARAQEIYNNLSKHRDALSLKEFDNEVPESVAHYFAEVEAVQEKVRQRKLDQQ